jgi:hypothetical protein
MTPLAPSWPHSGQTSAMSHLSHSCPILEGADDLWSRWHFERAD